MNRSSLFLRPTRYDGDSLSVREALAMGVRVVASATDFRPPGVTLYQTDSFDDLLAKVTGVLATGDASAQNYSKNFDNLEQVRKLYLRAVAAQEKLHVRNLRQV